MTRPSMSLNARTACPKRPRSVRSLARASVRRSPGSTSSRRCDCTPGRSTARSQCGDDVVDFRRVGAHVLEFHALEVDVADVFPAVRIRIGAPRLLTALPMSRRFRISRLWPSARLRRRWFQAFRRAPRFVQLIVGTAVVFTLWLALNWTYQVIRKPSELFFPVSGTLYKTPSETWRQYAPIFREHATDVITPDLLAALAQVEGSGNPVVRTYWRWSLTPEPFEVYRPASSAVGMYQITDGTFAEARRYCIHDHAVVEDGPWHELRSCWFNRLYPGSCRLTPSSSLPRTWIAA